MHHATYAALQGAPGPEMLPWVLAGVGTVISSLSGAVAFLYRGRIADLQARIKRQDEQIDEKDAQIERLLTNVEPRVERIEGRQSRVR